MMRRTRLSRGRKFEAIYSLELDRIVVTFTGDPTSVEMVKSGAHFVF